MLKIDSQLTPEQRTLRARLAAEESWARTQDRSARTAAARKAMEDRWVREARERFGDLPADELARRAEHLKRAHFTRLALKSSQARSRGKRGRTDA